MESLAQIRLLVCGSRGGWHRRTPAEVAALWRSLGEAEKTAMRERLSKLTKDQRAALERKLAAVTGWGESRTAAARGGGSGGLSKK